ncbi:MAG: hypothetical protein IIY77_10380, partial [Lachnospiraceae bacterium]|nr:hypothetical protein [Lachnospiraceae bacterium]
SYYYSFNTSMGLVSVFDGCGGAGARKYERYGMKTGAYMASRAIAGAAKDWFAELTEGSFRDSDKAVLESKMNQYLAICKNTAGNTASGIKSKLAKDFPSTASIILFTADDAGITAHCIWAGDSRCYLLDEDGLKQLTEDDLDGLNAMENLTADGILTNVVSASKPFVLHQKTIKTKAPAILFGATDGCFGYFSTPMEFENLLLSSLFAVDNIVQWEAGMKNVLEGIAGDDFTLSGAGLGFGSFERLKEYFAERYRFLNQEYINGLQRKTYDEKVQLWEEYRKPYEMLLTKG